MAKESVYNPFLFSISKAYVRVALRGQGTVIGKLIDVNLDEQVIQLEEVLSREQGRKNIEIAAAKGTFFLNGIAGMFSISAEHYAQMKEPISYAKYLNNYVCITANSRDHYGKLDRIALETVELKPSICSKLEHGKTKLYLEKERPIIITSDTIKSFVPETKENLMKVIEESAKKKRKKKSKS